MTEQLQNRIEQTHGRELSPEELSEEEESTVLTLYVPPPPEGLVDLGILSMRKRLGKAIKQRRERRRLDGFTRTRSLYK